MAPGHRICIFLTGGLGDFVASLPAMRLVRKHHPHSRILLVGNPLWLPLAHEGRLADETRSVEDLPLHAGFMGVPPHDHPLPRFLAGFDLIISWFGDREGRWEETLRRFCRGRVLAWPYHRVHVFDGHVSDYYLRSLEGLGFQGEDGGAGGGNTEARPFGEALFPEGRTGDEGLSDRAPFLCIHPGSGSARKNWPKEAFLEAARGAFRRWSLPSSVLLGPAEHDQRRFWREAVGAFLTLEEDLPILEAARLLRRASFYVGNDSGVTHLAAALGVPVVALFGPTDPARWAPRGVRVAILVEPISPDQVLEALGRLAGCSKSSRCKAGKACPREGGGPEE